VCVDLKKFKLSGSELGLFPCLVEQIGVLLDRSV